MGVPTRQSLVVRPLREQSPDVYSTLRGLPKTLLMSDPLSLGPGRDFVAQAAVVGLLRFGLVYGKETGRMTAQDRDHRARSSIDPERVMTALVGMLACVSVSGCGMLFSAIPAERIQSADVVVSVESCPPGAEYALTSCSVDGQRCEKIPGIAPSTVLLENREYLEKHFNWTAWALGAVVDMGVVGGLAAWGATDPDSMPYAGLGAGLIFLVAGGLDGFIAAVSYDKRLSHPVKLGTDFRKDGYLPKHVAVQVGTNRARMETLTKKIPGNLEMADARRSKVTAHQRSDLDAAIQQGSLTAMLEHVARWRDGPLSEEAHGLLVEKLKPARIKITNSTNVFKKELRGAMRLALLGYTLVDENEDVQLRIEASLPPKQEEENRTLTMTRSSFDDKGRPSPKTSSKYTPKQQVQFAASLVWQELGQEHSLSLRKLKLEADRPEFGPNLHIDFEKRSIDQIPWYEIVLLEFRSAYLPLGAHESILLPPCPPVTWPVDDESTTKAARALPAFQRMALQPACRSAAASHSNAPRLSHDTH